MNDITHDLLVDIERKDRRFRYTQGLFFFLVAIMLAFLLIFSIMQQLANEKLLSNQTQTIHKLSDSTDQQAREINDLQKHIDCIVELLRQPNRSTIVITDIQNCKITQFTIPQSTPVNNGPQASMTPVAPTKNQSSTQPTPVSSKPAQPSTPVNHVPTTPQPAPQPLRILGIPVCVPLTKICAN